MSADTEETQQRLKAALHYTVSCMCQRVAEQHQREFNRQLVAAITETAYRQCDIFAKDLEAFARHGKRSTVSTEDVKLLARRSTALFVHIQNKLEVLTQEQKDKKKSAGKKKSKDTEDSTQ
ncbi:centromere protein S [Gouania willdenowi]|uniref:centromere protein S n=1 Tax=Gouania willdenowi TaxID=441366 RepID=UPI0010563E91|nr:centromere protein S-like [Gouania willdenowi]